MMPAVWSIRLLLLVAVSIIALCLELGVSLPCVWSWEYHCPVFCAGGIRGLCFVLWVSEACAWCWEYQRPVFGAGSIIALCLELGVSLPCVLCCEYQRPVFGAVSIRGLCLAVLGMGWRSTYLGRYIILKWARGECQHGVTSPQCSWWWWWAMLAVYAAVRGGGGWKGVVCPGLCFPLSLEVMEHMDSQWRLTSFSIFLPVSFLWPRDTLEGCL